MSSTGGRTPSRKSTRPGSTAQSPGTPGSRRSTRSSARTATTPNRNETAPNNPDEVSSPPLRPMPTDLDDSPSSRRRQPAGEDADSSLRYDDESPNKRARPAVSERSSQASMAGEDDMSSQGSHTNAMAHGRRADLPFTPAHHRTIRIERPSQLQDESEDDGRPRVYIWGTRICVTDVQRTFRAFLLDFVAKPENVGDDENAVALPSNQRQEIDLDQPYYLERLTEIEQTDELHLNINLHHVKDFNEAFYRKIVCYPADIIPYLDMTVNELFVERFSKQLRGPIEVRPFNAERTRNMRGLNPDDIDQLITITGMITRTSPLVPEMRQGYFECTICKNAVENEVDRGRIEEPTVCSNCDSSHCFQLIHNRSIFMDKQIIKLQESPDDMPAGQTPHTVTLIAHGNVVESVQPGDRVTVTGIYRAMPMRVNPRMRTVRSVYRTNVDVLHFRKNDVHRLHQQGDGSFITDERMAQIVELSKKPDIVERLAHALAPSIYEHDDIKKGILCLLFGGTNKSANSTQARSKHRSEINILLCGDPGTSKSQLLQYVFHLVPRAQYTSGKGTSAVGLTAAVTRDPETNHFVLQTGALVLADNGVCCIDEFDKMNDSTRSVLHEVMEQQTLSIAKAGIICQLNARTSILAAANPVDSQWNRNKTIVENVQLPHTLLSRFDLIFLLVDPQDEYYDRRLATHLVSLYHKSKQEEDSEFLDMSLIRDYISYAKNNVHPKLTDESSQCLIDRYIQMRKVGSGRGCITAYPRQLESLVRLAEASAKIRLAVEVTVADVEEAYRLHREALKQSAVDPATGRVDVNILAVGMSSTTRKTVEELSTAIKLKLKQGSGGNYPIKKLLYDLRESSERAINRELFEEGLNELVKNDIIVRTGDKIRLISSID